MSETGKPQVCIVMGSTSDLPTMEAAIDMLKEFEIPYVVRVLSAHRTPNETLKLAEEAMDNGIRVFIAGGFVVVHRSDARRHPGSDHGHRQGRRQERRHPGRADDRPG